MENKLQCAVVEGGSWSTTLVKSSLKTSLKSTYQLVQQLQKTAKTPIINAVYQVLYKAKTAKEVVAQTHRATRLGIRKHPFRSPFLTTD